jgi:hypothetical protein
MLDWAKSAIVWVVGDSHNPLTEAQKIGRFQQVNKVQHFDDVQVSNVREGTRTTTRSSKGLRTTTSDGELDVDRIFSRGRNVDTPVVKEETMSPPANRTIKTYTDRERMPPPPLSRPPRDVSPLSPEATAPPSTYNGSVMARTMPSTSGRLMTAGIEDHELAERARRYQEAFKISADSGIWYQSEAGLYYHLGLRSFEPLLPASWMVDFKTFPVVLFERDLEADCLIRNVFGPQFHAIRSLRELIETGNRVRDLISARHKMARVQQSIQHSLQEYLQWALHDGDLYETSSNRPVHVIVRRRSKQSTIDAVAQLAAEMASVLQQHARCYIEEHDYVPNPPPIAGKEPEPEIHDDSPGNNPPVIIGFLIVRTTVSVFTLNALNAQVAEASDHEGRGIHMLGRFDFLEDGMDVWNALALAICCCHLRNGLLATAVAIPELQERMALNGDDKKIDHGRIAGYVSRAEYEAARKRKHEDEHEASSDIIDVGARSRGSSAYEVECNGATHRELSGKPRRNPMQQQGRGRKRVKKTPDSDPDL